MPRKQMVSVTDQLRCLDSDTESTGADPGQRSDRIKQAGDPSGSPAQLAQFASVD